MKERDLKFTPQIMKLMDDLKDYEMMYAQMENTTSNKLPPKLNAIDQMKSFFGKTMDNRISQKNLNVSPSNISLTNKGGSRLSTDNSF